MAASERVERLVGELTRDEKVLLLAGSDMWSTHPVPRLGIPKVRVTDGPSGARGGSIPGATTTTSLNVPCAAALGATWDVDLIERIGATIGVEARTKSARVLLAPTVNIHRSPLSGRNFECYSEDPLLSGRAGAAFIRGAQSSGVATTVKHFVGNEAETERYTTSSNIDERALREIYLVPFEHAVRDGGTLGVMTAYNRMNGPWCAEHEALIAGILRDEWGFEGFVISDWFACAHTTEALRAGLDLEMPGTGRFYGDALERALAAGDVHEEELDAPIRRLLRVFERVGAFDDPMEPPPDQAIDRPEDRELVRTAAAQSMVLLRNNGVLPLDASQVRTLAVLGPNANRLNVNGGGSASLNPHHRSELLPAIRDRFSSDVEVTHVAGCDIDTITPALRVAFDADVYAGTEWAGDVRATKSFKTGEVLFFGPVEGVGEEFSFRAHGSFTPESSGAYEITLVQAGRARLHVDNELLLDGITNPPPPGTDLFELGSKEMKATLVLTEGTPIDIDVEYTSLFSAVLRGVKLGLRAIASDDPIAAAVEAAAHADAAIVVVGTNAQWESEGSDRIAMDLPGEQDELVRRVAAANPSTVVVVNTASPVTMDWAGDVGAIVQAWFGGQEMGDALTDVLFGDAEPSGRLPTTIPMRLEHNPSYGNFPTDNGEVHYRESIFVGYRWYDARALPTRFPFGHGLSYTTCEIGTPALSRDAIDAGETVTVEVTVTNTGARRGAEVVQCYVAPRVSALVRPPKELKAFAKVWLDPGESQRVQLELDARAFSYWDPGNARWDELTAMQKDCNPFAPPPAAKRTNAGWRIDAGVYDILVGRSSADLPHCAELTIAAAPTS
jgi:beta-glucosidase